MILSAQLNTDAVGPIFSLSRHLRPCAVHTSSENVLTQIYLKGQIFEQ